MGLEVSRSHQRIPCYGRLRPIGPLQVTAWRFFLFGAEAADVLPRCRFLKDAMLIGQIRRKLTRSQHTSADRAHKGGIATEHPALLFTRIQNAHRKAQLLRDQANRLSEIGVIRNEYRNLKASLMGVMEQVRGNIDIGALLFALDDIDHASAPRGWVCKEHPYGGGEKRAIDNRDDGERSQRAEVDLLALGLPDVGGAILDPRRKVFDAGNGIACWKDETAHGLEIEPFVGRAFERAIVEVEPIHIDTGLHRLLIHKQSPAEAGLAPYHRSSTGGTGSIA